MKFLLFIGLVIGLLLLFFFVAKLIVNKVPRKFHWIISLLLLLVSFYLGYKIYDSIIGDIKFNKEKVVRFQKSIDQLKLIRDAELSYKSAKGVYSDDYSKLIEFIQKDSLPLTISKEKSKKVRDRGIDRVVEYKETDTVGWRMVMEDFKGRDIQTMMNVPGTDQKFELKTGFVEKGVNKYKAPVFEVKVNKSVVLDGLSPELIKRELNIVGVDEINGEYITVGTLEDVKETGNWPPSYDQRTDKDTK